jgi:predicted dehydrogenase
LASACRVTAAQATIEFLKNQYVERNGVNVGFSQAALGAEDGYHVVELIEACYQSARDGARVHLDASVRKI